MCASGGLYTLTQSFRRVLNLFSSIYLGAILKSLNLIACNGVCGVALNQSMKVVFINSS